MTGLEEIRQRLEHIENKVNTANESLAAAAAGTVDSQRRLALVESTVYGNGTPGLKGIAAANAKDISEFKKHCLDTHSLLDRQQQQQQQQQQPSLWLRMGFGILQAVLTAGILAVTALILGLWKTH